MSLEQELIRGAYRAYQKDPYNLVGKAKFRSAWRDFFAREKVTVIIRIIWRVEINNVRRIRRLSEGIIA